MVSQNKEQERFRSFAERYLVERASTFRVGSEDEDAWKCGLNARTAYDMVEQLAMKYADKPEQTVAPPNGQPYGAGIAGPVGPSSGARGATGAHGGYVGHPGQAIALARQLDHLLRGHTPSPSTKTKMNALEHALKANAPPHLVDALADVVKRDLIDERAKAQQPMHSESIWPWQRWRYDSKAAGKPKV